MEEVFDEVLAVCLDRIVDGDSAEACAAEFPEFPDLLPLLQLANDLRSVPGSEGRLGWLDSASGHPAGRRKQ